MLNTRITLGDTMASTLVLQAVGTYDLINTPEDSHFSVYSNAIYANYHQYDMVSRQHQASGYAVAWDKILFLMEELIKGSHKCIYVLSNNSRVADMRKGLEDLLASTTKDVIMHATEGLGVNTTGFVVRNTPGAYSFFQAVLDYVNKEAPQFKLGPAWDAEVVCRLLPQWEEVVEISNRELFNLK